MTLAIYMDVHVRRAVTEGLRRRGVDVLTAQEDGTGRSADPDLLERATSLGRVLFTNDRDLLAEAHRRQTAGIPFAGVVYAHQVDVSIGQCVNDLEILATFEEPSDFLNRVTYLPL